MSFSIIILAAGKGTRMKSKVPKIFHKVGNVPMIFHVLNVSKSLKPRIIFMVISKELETYTNEIKKKYKNINFTTQAKQLGTADAVNCAVLEKSFANTDLSLILCGDTPLISQNSLKKFIDKFKKTKSDLCVLSMIPPYSNHSYGRLIIKNDYVEKIIEKSELKANQNYENLCNTGIMLVKTKYLKEKLKKVKNSNSKKNFI